MYIFSSIHKSPIEITEITTKKNHQRNSKISIDITENQQKNQNWSIEINRNQSMVTFPDIVELSYTFSNWLTPCTCQSIKNHDSKAKIQNTFYSL